ncbi:MAG: LLM class flavin-dependent oxidoreductase, partial [Rhizobiales bacterium]|nr:LLM class flavin-dependent oxidoreductase [Hyphomicrobiales bacterium]
LRPYTYPHPHIAVASAVTPFGAVLAGKHGLGMLCVAASSAAGYDVLDTNWEAANKEAAKHGRTMDRADLRLVAPFHLAETREEAIEQTRWGWEKHNQYTRVLAPHGGGLIPTNAEEIIAKKSGVIGTPDDAVEFLERYWEKTGGFGCILHLAINWPRFEHVKRSAELFARYVMPKFTGRNLWREAAFGWIAENSLDFAGQRKAAANQAIDAYFGKKTG